MDGLQNYLTVYQEFKKECQQNDLLCLACTNPLRPIIQKIESCRHVFCQECLEMATKKSSLCPLCNKSFQKKEVVNFSEKRNLASIFNELLKKYQIQEKNPYAIEDDLTYHHSHELVSFNTFFHNQIQVLKKLVLRYCMAEDKVSVLDGFLIAENCEFLNSSQPVKAKEILFKETSAKKVISEGNFTSVENKKRVHIEEITAKKTISIHNVSAKTIMTEGEIFSENVTAEKIKSHKKLTIITFSVKSLYSKSTLEGKKGKADSIQAHNDISLEEVEAEKVESFCGKIQSLKGQFNTLKAKENLSFSETNVRNLVESEKGKIEAVNSHFKQVKACKKVSFKNSSCDQLILFVEDNEAYLFLEDSKVNRITICLKKKNPLKNEDSLEEGTSNITFYIQGKKDNYGEIIFQNCQATIKYLDFN